MLNLTASDLMGLATGDAHTELPRAAVPPLRNKSMGFIAASTAVGVGLVYLGVTHSPRNKAWHVATLIGAINLTSNGYKLADKISSKDIGA